MLGRVNTSLYRRSHPAKSREEINREHICLSNLVGQFFHSIPESLKNPFKPTRSGELDSCLLSAHAMIHTSLIQLNEDLVRLDHHGTHGGLQDDDVHLQICQNSGKLLISWFIQLIRYQSQALIGVDLGHLLCGNPALNFCLSVALRTHCRLIAINQYITQNLDEHGILHSQINQILTHLSKSGKMPLEGRVIEMINHWIDNPSQLLPPGSIIHRNNTITTGHPRDDPNNPSTSTQPKLQGDDGSQSGHSYPMKGNFALARILNPPANGGG